MEWIVVNIGCIECGVSSNIVGRFDDEAKAIALAAQLYKTHGLREGGQNEFEVFQLPPLGVVADEYLVKAQ